MRILVKNGIIIDPAQGLNLKNDILIDKGKIVKIAEKIAENADLTIDATGKIVVPGFVDMHTHLREPGQEDKETVKTALKAAIAGGFTTISAMPNTDPPCDDQAHVKFILEKAAQEQIGTVLPFGTITKGRKGEQISPMAELKAAGCKAISDDGDSVADTALLRTAMEYATMLDLLVISHCEDKALAGDGVMHEGYWSTVLGMKPIPAEAESIIVERDINIADLTGARVHIAHVSSAKSVEIIRKAKKRKIEVTAEVTPHHFSLTDEALKTFDTNLKVNPPLRTARDIEALKKGLQDGTIDVIATDHAPHLENEKEREFDYAPFGMIGLETALSLAIMNLIDTEVLDWMGLVDKLATTPASILKINKGTLNEGADADVTIIDPTREWVYSKESIKSRSKNSPFVGKTLKGKVTDVIIGGRQILRNGDFLKQ